MHKNKLEKLQNQELKKKKVLRYFFYKLKATSKIFLIE